MDQLRPVFTIELFAGLFLLNLGSERCKIEFHCRCEFLYHAGDEFLRRDAGFINNHMRMFFCPTAEEEHAFLCQLDRPPNGIAPIVLYGTPHQLALERLSRLWRTHQNTNSTLSITTHNLEIIALIVDDILQILSTKFHKIICLGHQVAFLHEGVFDKSYGLSKKVLGR